MSLPGTVRDRHRATSVVDLIGNTPLIRLRRFETGLNGVELYGKAEWFNPGGSVKDRPAANMVKKGLESGALRPGKILLDATSGNTGIAYAMLGAALDIPVTLVVPASASDERKGHSQQAAHHADQPEPLRHLRLAPAHHLEVVVQRRHPKQPPASRKLEIHHLQHD